MNKSPEQYFQDQAFNPKRDESKEEFSSAEQAFLEKYLGVEKKEVLDKLGIESPAETVALGEPAAAQAPSGLLESDSGQATTGETVSPPAAMKVEEKSLEESLKLEENLQLVGFFLGQQELTVPISMVQEVIRFVQPTKLPSAPEYLEGIVNFRGKVTPLIRLSSLLGTGMEQSDQEGFIVVCRYRGLQMGLITQTMASMYRVSGKDVEWGVESHLGVNVEYIIGLLKSEGRLIGILSLDRIVEKIL